MAKVDKLSLHKAKAFVVTCMDFRFIPDALEHLKEKGYELSHDMFVLAGVSLGLNQTTYPEWGKALINHIEISKKLHHIEEVILVDHMDCGAYKTFIPGLEPSKEHDLHLENLAKAKKTLEEKFNDLKILTWIIHVDGKLETI
ncbi:MAG: hypothetical protein MJ252_08950 [archaeon]|nr:hypothetical protein [archaeon]